MTENPRRARRSRAALIRHGQQKRSNPVLKVIGFLAASLGVVGVSAGALGAYAAISLTSRIEVVELAPPAVGEEVLPQIGTLEGGTNILIVGTDSRAGKNSSFGSEGGELNDVNILVHISENQKSVTVVSFPRDLMVPIPSCRTSSGGWTGSSAVSQINVALSRGGLPCVVLTIEALTGLKIPYAAMISFNGVIQMANAVGGVEICVTGGDIYDPYAKVWGEPLSLSEGKHTIKGATALAYLRSRHGVGDGSDLGRISSQQAYLSSLLRTVKENGTLTDLPQLYSIANSAASNMTLSSSLANLDTMIALARILSKVDLDKVAFLSYPGKTGSTKYPGRVEPIYAEADKLFDLIKKDQAVKPASDNTGRGSVVDDKATNNVKKNSDSVGNGGKTTTLSGSVQGQLASDVTCSLAN